MNTFSNHAAWVKAVGCELTVSDAPMPIPGAGEVLIRNRAIGLNPFDRIVHSLGGMITPWVKYPAILGSDVAGEVITVGPSVSRFSPGDRVLGLALGVDKLGNRAAEGAFQQYVILREDAATVIPDAISFEEASVLPLAIATAASGLFLDDQLGLKTPSVEQSVPNGKTVLIWGGSTSVGSCAIQLAVCAGYEVVTTSSPKNFDYVRRLGATAAFDYNDPYVVDRIIEHLADRHVVGALAIASGSGAACIDIVSKCQGRRIVTMASAPFSIDDAPLTGQFLWKLTKLPRLLLGFAGLAIRARFKGVTTRSLWGTDLMKGQLGQTIFRDFLGPALEFGRVVPAPPPVIVGTSIDSLPAALSMPRSGLSASKLVVSI